MTHPDDTSPAPAARVGGRAGDESYPRLSRIMAAEGGFQAAMTHLTSDVMLTGFALALGAGPVHIGLLATLPLGLRLSQLFTSTRFERLGRWRTVALAGGLAGRVALLAGLLTLLMPAGEPRVWVLIAVVAAAAAGGAAYDLAIVAWMAEIVPLRLRGEFFGRRNRAVAGVGLAVTLGAASIIDSLQSGGETSVAGFAIIFGAGAVIGLAGLLVLARAPAGPAHPTVAPAAPLRIWVREAFADRSFYRLARFGLIWGFAVNFASPFFAVYQISVLALPLTVVTVFKAITTLGMMASSRYWGRLADHFGTKPVVRMGVYMIAVTPLLWLFVMPGRIWPLVPIQVLSGVAFAAYEGSINNLVLKLAPPVRRSRFLAVFGAAYGIGSVVAPLAGGTLLWWLERFPLDAPQAFFILFASGAFLRLLAAGQIRGVVEPGGVSVGHMIRVMGRFRAMTLEFPFEPFLHYVYTPAARVADYIAPEHGASAPPRGDGERRAGRDDSHV
jgi:MFS family permease